MLINLAINVNDFWFGPCCFLKILLLPIQKRGILVEIKACEKFYHRRPERSALGVHIVDIPRIKF
jgi:hypothetical protein